jgi:hypothetical protein
VVPEILEPVRRILEAKGMSYAVMRYGHYREEEFERALRRSRSMIFLCEHETQGIAYQQALSSGVPIMAWDRAGPWRDPTYFPKVVFGPVSSVPYWDGRCGSKFWDAEEFEENWAEFWSKVTKRSFSPRSYILENLSLELRAKEYVTFAEQWC